MKNYQLSPQHYLDIAQKANHPYYTNFIKAYDDVCNRLNHKQQKALEQKLQLVGQNRFNEEGFIQIACETTVCAYFADLYPNKFRYEHQCNKPKDVDCQFTDGKYTYNVEVKCPGLGNYKSVKSTWPKFEMIGRLEPKSRALNNKLMEIVNESLISQKNEWQYNLQKSLDNTMKTFLQEAH